MPSVSFDLKGSTVTARAWLPENHVQLNATALLANPSQFESDIVPHELAHLLAFQMYGPAIAPHGDEWRGIMRALGVRPSVTYDASTPATASSTSHVYACRCRRISVSVRRHNELQSANGQKVMECQRCGGRFYWSRGSSDVSAARVEGKPLVGKPTEKMLMFAARLSESTGVPLPAELQTDFAVCQRFIDAHKHARDKVAQQDTGVACLNAGLPSESQLGYARALARRRGIVIPPKIEGSRPLLSRWIDLNR